MKCEIERIQGVEKNEYVEASTQSESERERASESENKRTGNGRSSEIFVISTANYTNTYGLIHNR